MTVTATPVGRRGYPGAHSPFPLGHQVPAMLADDPMIRAFLAGLDEVWAPIVTTLDCFYAYLDPGTAPVDMVAFLGSWIRADVADAWNEESVRRDVAQAQRLFSMAGTAYAIRERIVPRDAESVEIDDPGATLTSAMPTDPQDWTDPGDPTVRIRVHARGELTDARVERIRSIIADLAPAHVVLDVSVR